MQVLIVHMQIFACIAIKLYIYEHLLIVTCKSCEMGLLENTLSFAMVQLLLCGVYMYMHIKRNASISFLNVLM